MWFWFWIVRVQRSEEEIKWVIREKGEDRCGLSQREFTEERK